MFLTCARNAGQMKYYAMGRWVTLTWADTPAHGKSVAGAQTLSNTQPVCNSRSVSWTPSFISPLATSVANSRGDVLTWLVCAYVSGRDVHVRMRVRADGCTCLLGCLCAPHRGPKQPTRFDQLFGECNQVRIVRGCRPALLLGTNRGTVCGWLRIFKP